MASLKSIRKRIGSVKSTQKITKAMKMVAAAKLRRAQIAAIHARDYTRGCSEMLARVVERGGPQANPMMTQKKEVKTKELWVLNSDRGLCGGFNSNLLRRVGGFLANEQTAGVVMKNRLVGRKARDYFKSKGWKSENILTGFYDTMQEKQISELAQGISERFLAGDCDEVWIAYNRFQSAMVQVVTVEKLLPFAEKAPARIMVDYLYEPNAPEVLAWLTVETLTAKLRQALLESQAAELAARMTAMESATSNASDMISYLTLQYNRVRQATITRELMDIIGGAEAAVNN